MSFLRNPTWQAKVNDKSKEACKHASRPNRLVHPTPDSTSNRHSSKAFLEPLQKQDNRLLHPHGEAVARTLTFVHQQPHTACFSKQVINIERDVHVLACIRFLCIYVRTDVSTRLAAQTCIRREVRVIRIICRLISPSDQMQLSTIEVCTYRATTVAWLGINV